MSLHAISGSSSQIAARAAHLHAVRHAGAQVEIEARSQVEERASSNSLVDVVARQLSGGLAAVAAPIAVSRRSKAVPFGKRVADDDYEGPISLDQDEFAFKPTRVRRQSPSTTPGNPGTAVWQNGDIGTLQALYRNGTFKNIMVGDVVYASQGSEDGSADDAVPLQVQIATADGGAIQSGQLFSLIDYLAPYVVNGGAKPWVGLGDSENTGVPYWLQPVTTVQYVWAIDTTTGELTATYQDPTTLKTSVLQFATNDNTVPPAGSPYSGNGDTDAYPVGSTIDALHSLATLRLVQL